jgi:hypothetical protein
MRSIARFNGIRLAFLLISLVLMDSCGDKCTEPCDRSEPDRPTWNGSFEWCGQPALDGWEFGNPHLARPVAEAPPGGGGWCLRLEADWAPTLGFARCLVPDVEDGDILRLTAFVRAEDVEGGGLIALLVGSWSPLPEMSKWARSAELEWTHVSLQDTITLAEGDSVWVLLSSFNTEITRRVGLFDMVVVERMSE